MIWEGGLSFYGAAVGALVALAVLARRRGMRPALLTDAAAPAAARGEAVGHMGCLMWIIRHGNSLVEAKPCRNGSATRPTTISAPPMASVAAAAHRPSTGTGALRSSKYTGARTRT